MKRNRFAALAIVAVLSSSFAFAQRLQIEMVDGHEVVAHEVLFRMRPEAAAQQQQVVQAFGAGSSEPVGGRGLMRLRAQSLDVPTLLAALRLNSQVEVVEPNYIIHISDTVPNDTYFGDLWGMQNTGQTIQGQTGVPYADIGVVKAWDVAQGSPSIVVGVVDTGVDYNHSDLAANVWTAQTTYQIIVGGSTYLCPPGNHGFNFITLSCDPFDDNMHGTHVSGTIGAVGNNRNGVTGVNWATSILALKFLDQTGTGTTADAISAIEAAVHLQSQGVNIRILNNSWGVAAYSATLLQAVNDANTSNILFVAAAGNDGSSNDSGSPEYPASFSAPNVISVAATDNQDSLASFSNYGAGSVHLGAPGVDVESTVPGSGYAYLSGTSMASPHVAGTAALVLSACSLNTAQLRAAILNSVDPIPSLIGKTATGGRVNAFNALVYCGAASAPHFSLTASPAAITIAPGTSGVSQINLAASGGFNDAVTFSTGVLPSGITASFSTPSITGSGSTTLTLTTSSTTALQTYPITVQGASSSQTVSLTLNLTVAPPDFSLSASTTLATVATGGSVGATITVAPLYGFTGVVNLTATGMPSGVSASFSPTSLTASGNSTLTLAAQSTAAPGTYSITVQGASGTLTHTASFILVVTGAPDYTLSATPAAVSPGVGGSASSTIAVAALNGFSGEVSLAASGMPSGVTASFAPPSITGFGVSALTLTVSGSTASGMYPITVQGTSGSLLHTVTVTLTVNGTPGTPDYTLSATPATVSTAVSSSASSTIVVSALSGFSGAVNLTASGMPSGVTASFAPAAVTGSGASTLTLTASASAAVGTYPIVVKGVSGSLSHTITVSLTVASADFTLSASPTVVMVSPGGSATSTITIGVVSGFSGSVNLTATGLPAGVTASFSPPSVTGAGSSTLTVVTSANTPPVGFSVNVQGVSGILVHTAAVAVTFQASIVLPANVPVLLPGSSVPYPVTLGAPATGNILVSLTSSDTTKVTITPANILFSAGSTTPSATPKLSGVNFGSATITASAWNYATSTQSVAVTDSFSFYPSTLTIGQGAAQYLTLTLAAPLSSDLTVNLSSDNPGVATVPATATISANATTVSVRVTGIGGGSATIHANALPSVPDTTATVTVGAALTIATTSLGNGSINVPYSQTLMAIGGTPPLTWALISGTLPTGLTLNPTNGQIAGTPTAAVANTPLTFKVSDSSFPSQTATANLTLTIATGGPVPSSITASKGTPQSTTVNTAFAAPLVATVTDNTGKPVSGVTVTFSAPGTGATGTFATGTSATVTTDSTGAATTPFTANGTAGSYTVMASIPGTAAPASFLLTNLAGPAAHITATSGSGQIATVNTAFSGALVVSVSDASGNPVSGAIVTFTVPAAGASGTFAGGANTGTTNASGVATSALFTANGTPGTYTVSASVAGVAASAAFSLTNIGPPASITVISGSGQSQSINTAFTNPLVVKVQDAVGNLVSGATVTFTAPGSGASGTFSGSNLVTTSVATNASGIATAPKFTANSIGGSYTVTASVAGVGTAAVFSLINLSGIILPAGIAASPGSSTPFPVTLGVPAAAGGVYVALASSDPTTVTVAPSNIFFPGGSTTPSVTPKINGINLGSVTITASAWNYLSVSQQVQVSETLSFFPGSLTMSPGALRYVTLILSDPAPTDLTITLASDTPGVATVPQTVTFPANTTTLTVRVTSGATGSANITAGAPPSVAPASLSVTVM